MTVAVLGVLFVTALAAVDWYVWGMATVQNFRHPVNLRPLTLREMVNNALARVVALNAERLPQAVIGNAEEKPAAGGDDDGHGFKRVA